MKKGFTIVELVVILGIFLTILAFTTTNLFRAQNSLSQSSLLSVIVSDLNQQRLKAVTGAKSNSDDGSYGIYFFSDRYVTFQGTSYDQNNPSNYTVLLEGSNRFVDNTFQNSQIIFESKTGEVVGYSENSNHISIDNSQINSVKTITVNRLGTIVSIN